MTIRPMRLSGGWYPSSEAEWDRLFPEPVIAGQGGLTAGVVPHAGWYFSGELMLKVLALIPGDTELVVVAGGHLLPGADPLFWDFDAVETPFGTLSVNRDFTGASAGILGARPDNAPDNTVEVVMPALARLRPGIKVAGFRIPPDPSSLAAGRLFHETARGLSLKTVVIGSTDLTHYGPNYGFAPPESRKDPRGWAENRDRRFLEALLTGRGTEALDLANEEGSACSAGGAAAALAFAGAAGIGSGSLLGYASSLDRMEGASFVGYGGVFF
jgi:AmmeMemoRadiSam system protein B